MTRSLRLTVACSIALAVACEGTLPSHDGGAPSAFVRFAPSDAAPLAWGSVPFPSDLYLDDDGHPRIGALPTRLTGDPRFEGIRALVGARRGFCGTCNVYFAVEGALDPASVPPSASPHDLASAADAIVLADVDPASPERGRFFPLRVEHHAGRGTLAVRPARGFVLRRGRRYAAALTTSLRGADGSPLASSPDFVAFRDGVGQASEGVRRARDVLGPALDALVALGVARERIAAFTAFTVGDPTLDLLDVRRAVHAAPAPIARVDRVWSTLDEIDALLGVPSEDRPGIDVPARASGEHAVRHASVALVVTGSFSSPRFVSGSGTETGTPVRDAGGLAPRATEDVPFLFLVPAGVDLARLPVVVHHHGFNASRVTGFVLADTAGRAGAAVLSVDAFQHGERAHERSDRIHNVRGPLVVGADGFAETETFALSARVFALTGTPAGMELFPGYAFGAFLQFVGDVMAAVRLAREGDLAALRGAHPELASLAFDPERILYAGNSLGAVIGAGVLAAERDVAAYALDVQPGSIVESLAEGAEFRPLTESVFLPPLGVTPGFDDDTRAIVFDPTVDLFRWVLEPVDPLGLAPYLLLDRVVEGAPPDVLIQLASLDQLAAPPAAQAMIAAAGIPGVGMLDLAPIARALPPLSANLDTPRGVVTAAAYRFDPAAHGMLELIAQSSTHELPLVPPLVPRPSAIPVTNPIADVHAQLEAFFRSRIERGRAEVR